jgi:antitoxin MazE
MPLKLDTDPFVGYTSGIPPGGFDMVTKIQKWGNSQGLRLSKQLLEDVNISVGDNVDVSTSDGLIVISPTRRVRGKQNLQELISLIPEGYEAEELDWGEPVGKEIW